MRQGTALWQPPKGARSARGKADLMDDLRPLLAESYAIGTNEFYR